MLYRRFWLVAGLLTGCGLSTGTSTTNPVTPGNPTPLPNLVEVSFDSCQDGQGFATVRATVSQGLNRDTFTASINGLPIVDPNAINSSSNFFNGSSQFAVTYRLVPPGLNANGFNLFQVSFQDRQGQSFGGQATRTCFFNPTPTPSPTPASPPPAHP
ncbi:MAG: hypothetical protein Q6K70_10550 [Thermostichales cyanobacterium DRC_bins_46]